MDINRKKFLPPLAVDTVFFHCVFANRCKTKGTVGAVCVFFFSKLNLTNLEGKVGLPVDVSVVEPGLLHRIEGRTRY